MFKIMLAGTWLHWSMASDLYGFGRRDGQCCTHEVQCGQQNHKETGQRLLTAHMYTLAMCWCKQTKHTL